MESNPTVRPNMIVGWVVRGWGWVGWGVGGGVKPGSHDQQPCGHNSHCCTTGVLLFMLLS